MAIYLVQHGIARPREIDPDRPLSDAGRAQVERVAGHLRKTGITIRRACHSGKTRSEQTARIFAEALGDGQVQEQPGMAPNDSAAGFAAGLTGVSVLYAGHLPHLDKVVSRLTTGREDSGVITFTNGGVVCLEQDEAGYRIAWYLTPALCPG